MTINYDRLPEHLRDEFRRYIEDGIPGGGFMTAVMSNSLIRAALRADEVNLQALPEICTFLLKEAPLKCFGSPGEVEKWIKAGGLNGLAKERGK